MIITYYSYSILILISLFINNLAYILSEERKKILDEILGKQRKLAKLHTFALIITNKNNTIFEGIYGEDKDINEKTPFVIGSVSKSFTALALLKLGVEINKTLDQFDLKEYIDEEDAKKITIAELLHHTSGLQSFGRHIIYQKGKHSYSNYGYALLGKIIESKCKKAYHECMKELIFNPLGMTNTNAKYHKGIVQSYNNFFGFRTKNTGIKSEIENDDGFFIPAGFISSTIEDMGKYLRLYLNIDNEEYKDFSKYVKQMIVSGVEIDYKFGYGMGLFIKSKNNKTIYEHSGGTRSFLCQLDVYPDDGVAFFGITNTADLICLGPTEDLVRNIENFLINDYHEGISDSLFFFIHFTIDIIILIIIAIPLTYLIITIIRKIKKKEYIWFKGIKGKIIFGVEIFILIILPIIIIIVLYTADPDITYMIDNLKDAQFVLFTSASALFMTFIIKLVYIFIYNKYCKKERPLSNSESNDYDLNIIDNEN